MSTIFYKIRGRYKIERKEEVSVDDRSASKYGWQDVVGEDIWGFAQPIGSTQPSEKQYGAEQDTLLRHYFYCLPDTDQARNDATTQVFNFQRGDRITRTDKPYPVMYMTEIRPVQNIYAETDHLLIVCEERQRGAKYQ